MSAVPIDKELHRHAAMAEGSSQSSHFQDFNLTHRTYQKDTISKDHPARSRLNIKSDFGQHENQIQCCQADRKALVLAKAPGCQFTLYLINLRNLQGFSNIVNTGQNSIMSRELQFSGCILNFSFKILLNQQNHFICLVFFYVFIYI